jgi:hypothetical protein
MDKKKLIIKYMTILADLHKRDLSEALLNVYIKILEKYDYKQIEDALIEIVSTAKFFPKPAEILEALHGSKEDRALMSWMKVRDAIRKYGHYSSIDFGDPIIVKAISQIGGWQKLCSTLTDEMIWMQKEFERIYKNLVVSNYHGTDTIVVGYIERKNLLNGFEKETPEPVKIGNNKLKKIGFRSDKKNVIVG